MCGVDATPRLAVCAPAATRSGTRRSSRAALVAMCVGSSQAPNKRAQASATCSCLRRRRAPSGLAASTRTRARRWALRRRAAAASPDTYDRNRAGGHLRSLHCRRWDGASVCGRSRPVVGGRSHTRAASSTNGLAARRALKWRSACGQLDRLSSSSARPASSVAPFAGLASDERRPVPGRQAPRARASEQAAAGVLQVCRLLDLRVQLSGPVAGRHT